MVVEFFRRFNFNLLFISFGILLFLFCFNRFSTKSNDKEFGTVLNKSENSPSEDQGPHACLSRDKYERIKNEKLNCSGVLYMGEVFSFQEKVRYLSVKSSIELIRKKLSFSMNINPRLVRNDYFTFSLITSSKAIPHSRG